MHFTKERALKFSLNLVRKGKRRTKVNEIKIEKDYFKSTMLVSCIALMIDFYIVNQFLIIVSNMKQ